MSNREPETWEQRITLTSVGSEEVKWAIEDVEYGLDLISGDLPDVFCRDLVLGKSPEATFHCRYMELPQPGARHVALDGDIDPKGHLAALCDGGSKFVHTKDNRVTCFKMNLK